MTGLVSLCSCFVFHVYKINTSFKFRLIFVTTPNKCHFTHHTRWPWNNPFTFQMSGISNTKVGVMCVASCSSSIAMKKHNIPIKNIAGPVCQGIWLAVAAANEKLSVTWDSIMWNKATNQKSLVTWDSVMWKSFGFRHTSKRTAAKTYTHR